MHEVVYNHSPQVVNKTRIYKHNINTTDKLNIENTYEYYVTDVPGNDGVELDAPWEVTHPIIYHKLI